MDINCKCTEQPIHLLIRRKQVQGYRMLGVAACKDAISAQLEWSCMGWHLFMDRPGHLELAISDYHITRDDITLLTEQATRIALVLSGLSLRPAIVEKSTLYTASHNNVLQ
ncbi:hypothetical protein J6590_048632 [Homalodisca vitripennis]|nr:hypothetical protein J6590_048632 [Homalodisca vitripennis]